MINLGVSNKNLGLSNDNLQRFPIKIWGIQVPKAKTKILSSRQLFFAFFKISLDCRGWNIRNSFIMYLYLEAINVLLTWWPKTTNEPWPKKTWPGQIQPENWTRMTISSLNFLHPTKPQLLLELICWTSATPGANKLNLSYSWS